MAIYEEKMQAFTFLGNKSLPTAFFGFFLTVREIIHKTDIILQFLRKKLI